VCESSIGKLGVAAAFDIFVFVDELLEFIEFARPDILK
jgi:hypothetical protein